MKVDVRRRKHFARTLARPLATELPAGEFKPGDKIKIGAKDEELVFQRK